MIATHDLQARKSLGQNFLLDLNLTAKIARQAGDLTGCDVLEIGPGPGGLTRGLLAEGARRVLAIEKDARCLPALHEVAEAYPGRLQIINGDALEVDALAHLTPPIRVAANLPYNVGTELLVRWLTPPEWPPFWQSLTLMFQREVAERIVAQPGSKTYGRLAILAQWRADAKIVMSLPPEAFTPPPKVSSAVVHLTALPKPKFEADAAVLSRVVAMAIQPAPQDAARGAQGDRAGHRGPAARRRAQAHGPGRTSSAGRVLRPGARDRRRLKRKKAPHLAEASSVCQNLFRLFGCFRRICAAIRRRATIGATRCRAVVGARLGLAPWRAFGLGLAFGRIHEVTVIGTGCIGLLRLGLIGRRGLAGFALLTLGPLTIAFGLALAVQRSCSAWRSRFWRSCSSRRASISRCASLSSRR